jgi:hypothetical protein
MVGRIAEAGSQDRASSPQLGDADLSTAGGQNEVAFRDRHLENVTRFQFDLIDPPAPNAVLVNVFSDVAQVNEVWRGPVERLKSGTYVGTWDPLREVTCDPPEPAGSAGQREGVDAHRQPQIMTVPPRAWPGEGVVLSEAIAQPVFVEIQLTIQQRVGAFAGNSLLKLTKWACECDAIPSAPRHNLVLQSAADVVDECDQTGRVGG